MFETLYSTRAEYTIFSSAHETFFRTGHVLGKNNNNNNNNLNFKRLKSLDDIHEKEEITRT